ncbi:Uncharacterised protein [Actinobacillus seminis]|uniref:Uncharacterized protein n=1 Tax=Actinobacillus seminis TaxID=722 RepID=A0A380VEL3_9PAST|nr:Uncharacterised protein [Actinobacillus seminis]
MAVPVMKWIGLRLQDYLTMEKNNETTYPTNRTMGGSSQPD